VIDRIVAALGLALLEWVSKRIEGGTRAVDAKQDIEAMRLAGGRVRSWLRKQGGTGA
jgi:hypothetical protein